MIEKYRLDLEGLDTKVNLVHCKTYFTEDKSEGLEYVKEWIVSKEMDNVKLKISIWDNITQNWYEDSCVTYFQPNTESEFYIVDSGAHECRFKHSYMQEMVLHVPTRTLFFIDERITPYPEDTMNDPEVLFYKFKYTTELGQHFHFVVYCNLRGFGKSAEEIANIKEKILKPGARWFCDHLKERYRDYFQDDAYSKMVRKQREMKGL